MSTTTSLKRDHERLDKKSERQQAARNRSGFSWQQLREALPVAARKLNPAEQWRNPVMFIVWVGAALTTVLSVVEPMLGGPTPVSYTHLTLPTICSV